MLTALAMFGAAGCGIWDLDDIFGSGSDNGDPPTNPCAAVTCLAGNHCETHDVVCVRAPCPPIAECVPNAPKVACGGFAGLPCPGAGRCVDDPSDDCDPARGGADCIGMCVCVENALCTRDAVWSQSACACVAKT